MSNIGAFIKKLRTEKSMSQQQLADLVGVSKSAISRYESGEIGNMGIDKVRKMAKALGIDPVLFVSSGNEIREDNDEQSRPAIRINVYSKIPAGTSLEAIENILDWEEIPAEWARGGKEFFALQVEGDSMYPEYLEGDIIICQLQPDFEDGQDCVVFVNEYNATLKRCYHIDGGVKLVPVNPNYAPKSYVAKESVESYALEDETVKILGVVKEIRRKK